MDIEQIEARLRYETEMRRVWRLIRDHHASTDLDRGRAAREAALSKSQLDRRLRKAVGMTFFRLLDRYRVHRAVEELAKHYLTMAELAERVGFVSEASLRRAFRRYVGMTPSACRDRAIASFALPKADESPI